MIKSQEFKTEQGLLNEHWNYLMMYLIFIYYNKYALKISQQHNARGTSHLHAFLFICFFLNF